MVNPVNELIGELFQSEHIEAGPPPFTDAISSRGSDF